MCHREQPARLGPNAVYPSSEAALSALDADQVVARHKWGQNNSAEHSSRPTQSYRRFMLARIFSSSLSPEQTETAYREAVRIVKTLLCVWHRSLLRAAFRVSFVPSTSFFHRGISSALTRSTLLLAASSFSSLRLRSVSRCSRILILSLSLTFSCT